MDDLDIKGLKLIIRFWGKEPPFRSKACKEMLANLAADKQDIVWQDVFEDDLGWKETEAKKEKDRMLKLFLFNESIEEEILSTEKYGKNDGEINMSDVFADKESALEEVLVSELENKFDENDYGFEAVEETEEILNVETIEAEEVVNEEEIVSYDMEFEMTKCKDVGLSESKGFGFVVKDGLYRNEVCENESVAKDFEEFNMEIKRGIEENNEVFDEVKFEEGIESVEELVEEREVDEEINTVGVSLDESFPDEFKEIQHVEEKVTYNEEFKEAICKDEKECLVVGNERQCVKMEAEENVFVRELVHSINVEMIEEVLKGDFVKGSVFFVIDAEEKLCRNVQEHTKHEPRAPL